MPSSLTNLHTRHAHAAAYELHNVQLIKGDVRLRENAANGFGNSSQKAGLGRLLLQDGAREWDAEVSFPDNALNEDLDTERSVSAKRESRKPVSTYLVFFIRAQDLH